MALKSTVYKAELQVADLDRHVYEDHALTLARHPSETEERLMVRLVAFALHAHERLAFGPGLGDADEPDLWQRDLTGTIERWIEVGLPDARSLARACGRAQAVHVVAYGRGAGLWWRQIAPELERLRQLTVVHLVESPDAPLAACAQRSMRVSVTIQEGQVLVSADERACTLGLHTLKAATPG